MKDFKNSFKHCVLMMQVHKEKAKLIISYNQLEMYLKSKISIYRMVMFQIHA